MKSGIGVRAVVVATTRLPDILAYEITKGVFESFEDFCGLHPAFSTLSVVGMVDTAGRASATIASAGGCSENGGITAACAVPVNGVTPRGPIMHGEFHEARAACGKPSGSAIGGPILDDMMPSLHFL